ncbi:MAG: prepilin-type N-terminal cleavage/methylation domain-containing protein [Betaproteobacteria bacterium]|nr:prepilin-type N-terminal cleavage/methylation domain-containing protein [Betaproteobacteria bacterium]
MKSQPFAHLHFPQRQQGFSLLEIAIALALAALVSINYLYNQSQDTQTATAKVQAGYYLTVNDAVGKYMQTYYDDLKVMPSACSVVRLTSGETPTAMATSTNCKLASVSTSSPANAMQPSVGELQKLGMLDKGFQDSFLFSTDKVVNAPNASCTVNCSTTANLVPAVYVNSIQRWCQGQLITDDTNTCNVAVQLKSLTFNAQPFSTDNEGFFKLTRYQLLGAAIATMGGDGLMSLDTNMDTDNLGKLYGVGKKTSTDNPIQYVSGSTRKGIAGILAVQNAAEWRCSAN